MPDPLRVLFVGEGNAEFLAVELRRGGYTPYLRCIDAMADLQAALDSNPDIAICDSVSGECGALEALRAVQARGLDLPVIVISGKIEDSEVVAALSAGAADHLTRGNLIRLNAAVARELRAAGMRRERVRMEEQIRQAQNLETVGRLAAGVAHDFNNLLTVITGYSDLLLSRGELDVSQRTGLEEIRRSAERGGALTYQLLAFSRRPEPGVRRVSLNGLLLQMERTLQRLVGDDITLVTAPAASPDTVECDPGRLDQVILHLVVHARDAMPKGGKLTIETGNVRVESSPSAGQPGLPAGRYVTLSVTDTGAGMDAEAQSHLPEPFVTAKSPCRGTGLGLAGACGMVQQIGGDIGVTGESGQGTRVQIYLPAAKSKGRTAKGKLTPVRALAGAETILVVENDARVRKQITGVLRRLGYAVIEAGRAEEAINRAKAHRGTVHLAVVEAVLPEMSGQDLIRQIAALFPGLRALYVSGATGETQILESGEFFLPKPVLPEALTMKVREILGKKSTVNR